MTTAVERGNWRPSDTLAARFLLVRTALGKDRKAFAALTGLTENQLLSIESGRSPRDLPAKINRVHLATGVDRDWLMWGGPLHDGTPPDSGVDNGDESPLSGSNRRTLAYKDVLSRIGAGQGLLLPLPEPDRKVIALPVSPAIPLAGRLAPVVSLRPRTTVRTTARRVVFEAFEKRVA
jgi:transcriptional regulator with XRE-family HTH domain